MFNRILEWVYYSVKVLFFVGVVLFMVGTRTAITELQNGVKVIQQQNFENYNNTALLFSEVSSTLDFLKQYSFALSDYTFSEDFALRTAISDATKKAEQDNVASTSESLNRDNFIVAYIQQQTERPTYDYIKSMTVYLVQQVDGSDSGSIGTGTVIKIDDAATYILTNKHVCDFAEGTSCYVYQDGEKYPIASVKAAEVDHDIQVVKTTSIIPNKRAVRGLKDTIEQDRVYVVGHNNGNPFMYSEGTVSGFSRDNGDLIVGMPSGPGNSGSGIFTQDGYLTGVLYAGQVFPVGFLYSLDTAHGICVNSTVLRLFLAEYFN